VEWVEWAEWAAKAVQAAIQVAEWADSAAPFRPAERALKAAPEAMAMAMVVAMVITREGFTASSDAIATWPDPGDAKRRLTPWYCLRQPSLSS